MRQLFSVSTVNIQPATTIGIRARNLFLGLVAIAMVLPTSAPALTSMVTSHGGIARNNANTSETILTPANVNKNSFGLLFTAPVDYVVMAQPLYVSSVSIPGQGTHNVLYVVTQADSVYAIDADTGAQLWYASMLDGGTTASGTELPCGTAPGFAQEGVVGTPVIDPNTNVMYLVAKTVQNGKVTHQLHALDITTGLDEPGSPVTIQAQTTSRKGHVTTFNSLHQKNRPGLLLLNGVLYLGFGSNYCNDDNSGWVLAYGESNLAQLNVFNTSPDWGVTSIWQAGSGIAADGEGNIFVETAESGTHGYDVPSGGQTYCNSVLKLSPQLGLLDYFTPSYVNFLDAHDLDLSSTGVLILPDQTGPYAHELVAGGKQGTVYVLNRDAMGEWSAASDSGALQEVSLLPSISSGSTNEVLFGAPAYWNNFVYFAPDAAPIIAFPLQSNGLLGTPLTAGKYVGSHSPSVSANGTTNGILWFISGPDLVAMNATTLQLLYTSAQASGGRDALQPVGHFVTQTVANGKVYVATKTGVQAYGLLQLLSVVAGGGQSAVIGNTLPNQIQVQAGDAYNGQVTPGVTITFSDGGKGGSFNPSSGTTDQNGNVFTAYTVPSKAGTYTLTFTGTLAGAAFGSSTTTAIATAASATKLVASSGTKQTGTVNSTLPKPINATAEDAHGNPVAGVTINFSTNKGIVSPASVVSGSNGVAATNLQLPSSPATVTVTAGSSGLKNVVFTEYAVAAVATNLSITSGNNQTGNAGTQLPQALIVLVTDQNKNPLSGVNVTFSDGGAGGSFSYPNPVTTASSGSASQYYTMPAGGGNVTITVSAPGVQSVTFTESSSAASVPTNIAITGGNNQAGTAGTQLPQALIVLVTDQNNNPISGVTVSFSDGGAGGSFSFANPVTTGSNGTASQFYTLPASTGLVVVYANATGVSGTATFYETGQ